MLHPYLLTNLPCPTAGILFRFSFLILLVPLLYRSGSLDRISLLSFFTIGFLTTFLPNLKRLPRPFLRYSLAHRQRRLPFGAALTGYDFKCTFAGSTPFLLLNLLSYFSGKVLPFDTLTFFALASFTITISFSDVPAFFFQSKNERINLIN